MKKLSLFWVALAAFCLNSCGGGGGKNGSSTREVHVEENDVSDYESLTPARMDEAADAFREVLRTQKANPALHYTQVHDVGDQASSPLCEAFSFRDQLVNNLSLSEKDKPSVLALLSLQKDHPGKIVINNVFGYSLKNYSVFQLGSKGGDLYTEKTLPFDDGLFASFDQIFAGKAFKSSLYSVAAGAANAITLVGNEGGSPATAQAVLLDPVAISANPLVSKIHIPKFKVSEVNFSAVNLVGEMQKLAAKLVDSKAQTVGVCANYIRGFSKKLKEKDLFGNISDSSGCGYHAILATHARLDENNVAWITLKNSWGTELSDTGEHELTIAQFISILTPLSEDVSDGRIASMYIDLEPVPETVDPVHHVTQINGWELDAGTIDGIHPNGIAAWAKPMLGSKFQCQAKDSDVSDCHGRIVWRSNKDKSKYYDYDGELTLTNVTLHSFNSLLDGQGVLKLWGNPMKRGTFKKDLLVEGIYTEYFSNGRSSLVKMTEEGTFDGDAEDLIKGTRKYYDRAGTVYKTETVGL